MPRRSVANPAGLTVVLAAMEPAELPLPVAGIYARGQAYSLLLDQVAESSNDPNELLALLEQLSAEELRASVLYAYWSWWKEPDSLGADDERCGVSTRL